ncbi:MAG: acyltransferase domain-containing protein [Corynebacteriales bacterium]|nr:acyltransferase domain-containing protein [Mycobacteriales bacterium]
MTTLLMFPGQGSQRVGMGADVMEEHGDLVETASDITGFDIAEVCGSRELMGDTRFLQPALFVAEYLDYRAHWSHLDDVVMAGHSLGELVALCAAGAFGFEVGVELVATRARLMSEVRGGRMAAIMQIDADVVRGVVDDEFPDIDIANHNGYGQLVVSGPDDSVDALCDRVDDLDGLATTLAVSGAFHSRYMRGPAARFALVAQSHPMTAPDVPVVANATADFYGADGDLVDLMTRQLYSPVRWTESIETAVEAGVDTFVEVAPGKVLSGIVERMRVRRGWRADIVTGDAHAA